MSFRKTVLLCAALVASLATTFAATAQEQVGFGGDVFSAGNSVRITDNVDNDLFAGGNDVDVSGAIGGDAMLMGNTIIVTSKVEQNLFAAGNTVSISGDVGSDISAAGNTVTLSGATVGGNVRATAASVEIDPQVAGSVAILSEKLVLNGTVDGDFAFKGREIEFGPDAVIVGTVLVQSDAEIEIPERVASADRVTFEQVDTSDMGDTVRNVTEHTTQGFFGNLFGALGFYIFVFFVGLIWLAVFAKRSEASFDAARTAQWRSLLAGVVTLSAIFGFGIVLAMTLFGILLIPVAILMSFVAWVLGMAAGSYFVARRVGARFGQSADSFGLKALMLAVGLAFLWIVGIIPVIGWILQMAMVFFGLGAMAIAAISQDADAQLPSDAVGA